MCIKKHQATDKKHNKKLVKDEPAGNFAAKTLVQVNTRILLDSFRPSVLKKKGSRGLQGTVSLQGEALWLQVCDEVCEETR